MAIQFESYIGAACEVENAQNDLLLHGRLNAVFPFNGCTMEITSLDGSPLLRCEKDTAVKLHLFSNNYGPLFVGGRVVVADAKCWQVSDVQPVSKEERRGFFRIKIDSSARVHALDGPTVSARALSISLSGAMFSAKETYHKGDEVVLSDFHIGHDPIPFAVRCRVARIGNSTDEGTQYGCAFLRMAQTESDRMCRAIFELQHQAVRSRHPNRM
jgi:hypothetical protein